MFFIGSDRNANQNAISTFMPCLSSQLTLIVSSLIACLKHPNFMSENSNDELNISADSNVSSIHIKPLNRLTSNEQRQIYAQNFGPTITEVEEREESKEVQ